MFIKKLDEQTINLISAGEVIEEPADVLKELIENSIDAGSKNITISIKNSGIDLIEIKDDGAGIHKEDLLICLQKYTTSKLSKIDDIFNIDSYGFRGEALSTINAVSKLCIVSSTNNCGLGYSLNNNDLSKIKTNKGTTITVKDLFYNLPVRKKFLKSKSFEFTKLYNTFLNFVIINSNITFKFISEKKNETFYATSFENRLFQVFGNDLKNKYISLNIINDFFKLKGIISKPQNPFFYNTSFLYINKRAVYSTQITKIISEVYKDYLMTHQKPFYIFFIEFNKNTIDINVHPKKKFIKLQNELLFLNELKKELLKQLYTEDNNKINYHTTTFTTTFAINTKNTTLKAPVFKPTYTAPQTTLNKSFENNFTQEQLKLFDINITKIIGQYKDTYIFCETEQGLLLIDQHAAAERINLEKNRLKLINFDKQYLLKNIPLSFLSTYQKEFIKKNINMFDKLGFEIDTTTFTLKSLPVFLGAIFDKNIFIDLINDYENDVQVKIDTLKDKLIKLKSCKSSLKSNTPLSFFEIKELIKNLNMCEHKSICAHGRPTYILIKEYGIQKLFKRII